MTKHFTHATTYAESAARADTFEGATIARNHIWHVSDGNSNQTIVDEAGTQLPATGGVVVQTRPAPDGSGVESLLRPATLIAHQHIYRILPDTEAEPERVGFTPASYEKKTARKQHAAAVATAQKNLTA